jgi:ribose 5-phosphate isomerase B
MIFLGSDHLGFKYKQAVKKYLVDKGYQVNDMGPNSEKEVDFPKYAEMVARKVVTDPYYRGVLFSRTGVGMCIAANKVKGAFVALIYNEQLSVKSREENDTNIICLPSEFISVESAKEIVAIWLSTSFSGTEDSARHISLIREIEKNG